ncbi:hypothetical protein AB2M95_02860 [Pseudomonas chlororaphis]|uniref:hypothetical protein n=1 Tax=Pseudomonas chlororaphis TaxID=587753 RepID=UPI003461ABA6
MASNKSAMPFMLSRGGVVLNEGIVFGRQDAGGEGDFLAAKIIDALILLAFNASIFPQLRHENQSKLLICMLLVQDLKSPARKGVPVRFRLRAPSISRVCWRKLMQTLVRFRSQF